MNNFFTNLIHISNEQLLHQRKHAAIFKCTMHSDHYSYSSVITMKFSIITMLKQLLNQQWTTSSPIYTCCYFNCTMHSESLLVLITVKFPIITMLKQFLNQQWTTSSPIQHISTTNSFLTNTNMLLCIPIITMLNQQRTTSSPIQYITLYNHSSSLSPIQYIDIT